MTAAALLALAAEAHEETLHVNGMAEQARLRGLTVVPETFGLSPATHHLAANLRKLDPQLLNQIRGTGKEQA